MVMRMILRAFVRRSARLSKFHHAHAWQMPRRVPVCFDPDSGSAGLGC
jgi:hypothetical protein